MKLPAGKRAWIVGAGVVCLIAGVFLRQELQTATSAPASIPAMALTSELNSPNKQVLTHSTSLQEHAITWTVTNTGTEPMRLLQPQVDCRCHLVKDFPELISPGEAVTVTIRIVAPLAGRGLRQIPVYCSSLQRVVGILAAEFNVPVKPPFWIDPPKLVRLQTTSGKHSVQSCVWECIEAHGSMPHVTDVRLSPDLSDVGVSMRTAETAWGEDGQLVKRTYHLEFQMELEKASVCSGSIIVSTWGDEDAVVVPLIVDAKPQVSVFPQSLEFKDESVDSFKTITVVHRVLPPCAVYVRANIQCVSIEAIDSDKEVNSVRKYRVSLSAATAANDPSQASKDCVVTFEMGDLTVNVPISLGK